MGLRENIAKREEQIKNLSDPRWYDLAMACRQHVELEKKRAGGKPHEVAVCETINQGYLNMLDCILKVSK